MKTESKYKEKLKNQKQHTKENFDKLVHLQNTAVKPLI